MDQLFAVFVAICTSGTPHSECDDRSPALISWTILGEVKSPMMCNRMSQPTIAKMQLWHPGETVKIICRRHTQTPENVG